MTEEQYKAPIDRNYSDVPNMDQVSDWEKLLYTSLYDAGIKTSQQYQHKINK